MTSDLEVFSVLYLVTFSKPGDLWCRHSCYDGLKSGLVAFSDVQASNGLQEAWRVHNLLWLWLWF